MAVIECSQCRVRKPDTEFRRSRGNGKVTRRRQCVECRRAYQREFEQRPERRTRRLAAYYDDAPRRRAVSRQWHRTNGRERRYGLSQAEFEALVVRQCGLCLICELRRQLNVDHDHRTGEVRGLLCGSCNRGLGHYADSVPRLLRAAVYVAVV